MEQKRTPARKPSIIVTQSDYLRLSDLADAALAKSPDVADRLSLELERAKVKPDGQVKQDVVRMGSAVEYKTDRGETRSVTLVYPGDADIDKGRISILTPIGVALLGLKPGQSIDWTARDGTRHLLTVASVGPVAAAVSA